MTLAVFSTHVPCLALPARPRCCPCKASAGAHRAPSTTQFSRATHSSSHQCQPWAAPLRQQRHVRPSLPRLQAEPEERPVVYNTEFGYSRKDIFLIGAGLIALGYAMYYGLQAMGMEPGYAGNWVQLIIFLGICVGWVSTYVYRVATKQMTYVKQLENYEEAVMKKRLEELTDADMSKMLSEVEQEKLRRQSRGQADSTPPPADQ